MASCRVSAILLLLVAGALISCSDPAEAKKETFTARKGDIPFIKCSVCEAIAKQLVRQVKEKRENSASKKISEFDIIDVAENICNMKKEESDWILKLDIVEKGDKLQLVEQPVEGVCKTECKTIERACQEVMGDHDTDVAEYLYKPGATRAGVTKLLCQDFSKACVGKVPRVPKGRVAGEAFIPKEGKEAEMDKLMRSLNDVPGAPGMQMYSREELQKNPRLMDVSGDPSSSDSDDEDDSEEDVQEGDDVHEGGDVVPTPVTLVATRRRRGTLTNMTTALQNAAVKLGSQFGDQTKRLMLTASKSVIKARGAINSWWYGQRMPSTGKSASPSRPNSDSSSGEL